MIQEKLIKLIERLREKTSKCEINWEETIYQDEFQSVFSNFIVKICQREEMDELLNSSQKTYVMQILNDHGQIIDEINDSSISKMRDPVLYGNTLKELFFDARKYAMGLENAVDKILATLE